MNKTEEFLNTLTHQELIDELVDRGWVIRKIDYITEELYSDGDTGE
jgi:hypothetical protein